MSNTSVERLAMEYNWTFKRKPEMQGLNWSILGALFLLITNGVLSDSRTGSLFPVWFWGLVVGYLALSPLVWLMMWTNRRTGQLIVSGKTIRFLPDQVAFELTGARMQVSRCVATEGSIGQPIGFKIWLEDKTGDRLLCIFGENAVIDPEDCNGPDSFSSFCHLSLPDDDFMQLLAVLRENVQTGPDDDKFDEMNRYQDFKASPSLGSIIFRLAIPLCALVIPLLIFKTINFLGLASGLQEFMTLIQVFLSFLIGGVIVWITMFLLKTGSVQTGGAVVLCPLCLLYPRKGEKDIVLRPPFRRTVPLSLPPPTFNQTVSGMGYAGPGLELEDSTGKVFRIGIADSSLRWNGPTRDVSLKWDISISAVAGNELLTWLAARGVRLDASMLEKRPA